VAAALVPKLGLTKAQVELLHKPLRRVPKALRSVRKKDRPKGVKVKTKARAGQAAGAC
jgi:hypothetical protein